MTPFDETENQAHADRLYWEQERRRHDSVADWADSDVAPSWFDPMDAGERWDDDY
jgi:hypothetical protein